MPTDARHLGLIGRYEFAWWWTFALDRCYPDQRHHVTPHTFPCRGRNAETCRAWVPTTHRTANLRQHGPRHTCARLHHPDTTWHVTADLAWIWNTGDPTATPNETGHKGVNGVGPANRTQPRHCPAATGIPTTGTPCPHHHDTAHRCHHTHPHTVHDCACRYAWISSTATPTAPGGTP